MIILWVAGILDSILEKNTILIAGHFVQSSKRRFSILFLLQRVHALSLPGILSSEFIKLFLFKNGGREKYAG